MGPSERILGRFSEPFLPKSRLLLMKNVLKPLIKNVYNH